MRPDRPHSFWHRFAALRAEGLAGVPDAELVRRFADARDPQAFEEIARRHGGMVWAVCRRMLADPADAEDAFQAVFLTLVRSCGRVRHGLVGPWLHGAAVRGALKARRRDARARRRDRAAARPEAAPEAPAGGWDETLAAVHEEAARLPEALRVAFVTCDLEGVPQPDAAARLGWRPGTLTGRLSKARRRVRAALARRGLAPAAALGAFGVGGSAAPARVPTELLEKVFLFPSAAPAAVPAALAALALEIAPVTVPKVKLLALSAMMACGLAAGTGTVLVPALDAQAPAVAPPTAVPPPRPGQPPADPSAAPPKPTPVPAPPSITTYAGDGTEFVYKYVPRASKVGATVPLVAVIDMVTAQARDGWEFAGSVTAQMSESQYYKLTQPNAPPIVSEEAQAYDVMVFKKRVASNRPGVTVVDSKTGSTLTADSLTFGATGAWATTAAPTPAGPVCTTAFTVTETPEHGVSVTYTYKPGEPIPPQHLRYAGKNAAAPTRPAPAPAPAQPVTPAARPGVAYDLVPGALPAAAVPPAVPAADPVVIELKALGGTAVVDLCREVLSRTVKVVAVAQTNSVVLVNATPADVAKLKKLLALIDVPAKGPPVQFFPGNPADGPPPLDPTARVPSSDPLVLPATRPPGPADALPPPLDRPAPAEPAPKPVKKPKAKPLPPDRVSGLGRASASCC